MTINFTEQSTPRHVALIMDGNGRWAAARGLPRIEGHRAGADAVRTAVETAAECGVEWLTLYAFSSDNWKRPQAEVEALLQLFGEFLASEVSRCLENGIRLNVIGRRDRLPKDLVQAVADAERRTARGERMALRLAIDYSSREAIVEAACLGRGNIASRDEFTRLLHRVIHSEPRVPDVDLLIRTGREKRLSDFLLWECSYAELLFIDTMWPDFSAAALREALATFQSRERRFGAIAS
ncbi:MAG: polyprenyl diphosphate synthase [Thermoanaerobaculia bacterium]